MKFLIQLMLCFCILMSTTATETKKTKKLQRFCTQPKDPGPCKARLTRYFYNTKTNKCEEFDYGGCEGNGNNFDDEEDCKKYCFMTNENQTSNKDVDICTLPKSVGPCRASIERFYYYKKSNECLQFNYGGCLGNKNNFATEALCMKKCFDHGKKQDL